MVSKYTLRYEAIDISFASRTSERPQKIKLAKNIHSEKNTMDTVLFALDSEIKYFRTLLHKRKLFKLFIRLTVVVEQLY